MLEEATRMNAVAVRKAFEECYSDEESACGEPPDRLVESDARDRGRHGGGLRPLRNSTRRH
jgi:hypothetical protein